MVLKKIKLKNEGEVLYASLGDLHDTDPNREMGNLDGLRHSIEEIGLICPVAIDENGRLLAGRRRLAAAENLGWDHIPVVVFPSGDEVIALRVMIDENIRRKNLTDPEQAAFVKQFHEVLQKDAITRAIDDDSEKSTSQLDADIPSKKSNIDIEAIPQETRDAVWSQKKTAKILGVSQPSVSSAITIAEMVEADPERWAVQTGTTILRARRREEARKRILKGEIEEAPDYFRSGNFWYFNDRDPRYGIAQYPHGVVPGQIIENLLWMYTDRGDLVVDPLCGGGTFLDVANAWDRKCLAYDKVIIRDDIVYNDIWDGLPDECRGAKLIYLDPPYGFMVKDAYESMDDYFKFQDHIVKVSAETVAVGGYVAYIIMDYSNRDENGCRYGTGKSLIGEAYRALQDHPMLEFDASISVPIPSAGYRQVSFEDCKTEHKLAALNRIIWVARKVTE